jgi:hypothetical protein
MLPLMLVPLDILDLPHFPLEMLAALRYPSDLLTQWTAWLASIQVFLLRLPQEK